MLLNKVSLALLTLVAAHSIYLTGNPSRRGNSLSAAWLGRKVETIVKVTYYLKLLPCRV